MAGNPYPGGAIYLDDQTPNTHSDGTADERTVEPNPTDLAQAGCGQCVPVTATRVVRLIEVEPDDSSAQVIEVTRRRRRVNHRKRWESRGVDTYRQQAVRPPGDDTPNLDLRQ